MSEVYPPELSGLLARFEDPWPAVLEVGPGWCSLLVTLNGTLASIAPTCVVAQVKSKFAVLSFCARPTEDPASFDPVFTAAVDAAERESAWTCEECGAPATVHTVALWSVALCPSHARNATGSRR